VPLRPLPSFLPLPLRQVLFLPLPLQWMPLRPVLLRAWACAPELPLLGHSSVRPQGRSTQTPVMTARLKRSAQ
jgi:hypothetical protein